MTKAAFNIFVRVVKRRIDKGEAIDEILAEYVNLSDEDKEQIRNEVSK